MILHLFNPSHDEALAANSPYYYPATVARRLQNEQGALPALWAGEGHAVLLGEESEKPLEGAWCKGVRFVKPRELKPAFWQEVESIRPWGWDPLVRHQLHRAGAPEQLLPSDDQLATIRHLSSRHTTAALLPRLREKLLAQCGLSTVGESVIAESEHEALERAALWNGTMAKSLWSCSGRGVFRLGFTPSDNDRRRLLRLLREQGGVELEPVYTPVLNFALEFEAHPDGSVEALGVSLFGTNASGAYLGNAVAPQAELQQKLAEAMRWTADALPHLMAVCAAELEAFLAGRYAGPFGVDMMATAPTEADAPAVLHPCIELNLRRTMGHVALTIAQRMLNREDLPSALQNLCYFCELA